MESDCAVYKQQLEESERHQQHDDITKYDSNEMLNVMYDRVVDRYETDGVCTKASHGVSAKPTKMASSEGTGPIISETVSYTHV